MKVSVPMITYNHERYIAQAIESVLMQETDFDYELVIGEDCSTDRTRDIVVDYQRRYPDQIRLLLNETNIGGVENISQTWRACRGEYVAVLEGDDYWTSPHKLQKQVEFLDSHPECAMCFHDLTVVYEDGSRPPHTFCSPHQKEISTIEDLLEWSMMQTCSTMYRRGLVEEIPEWYYRMPLGDWAWNILTAQHGKLGYIDEVMGVYRKHAGGIWSGRSAIAQLEMKSEFYRVVNAHLEYAYDAKIRAMLAFCNFELAVQHYLAGSLDAASERLTAATGHFQDVADRWQRHTLDTAWEIETRDGCDAAQEFIVWICDAVRSQPLAAAWIRRLWGEWYAAHAFRAHWSGDPAAVRRAAWQAVRHNPRLLGNLGLASISVSAVIGPKAAAAIRRIVRAFLPGTRQSVA